MLLFKIIPDAFYSVKEVSEGLNVHVATTRRWIATKQIKCKKIGRCYMIPGSVLVEFLTIENTSEGKVMTKKKK